MEDWVLDNRLEVWEENIIFFVEVDKILECNGYLLTNSINTDTYISTLYEVINIKLSFVYWTKNPTKSWKKNPSFYTWSYLVYRITNLILLSVEYEVTLKEF